MSNSPLSIDLRAKLAPRDSAPKTPAAVIELGSTAIRFVVNDLDNLDMPPIYSNKARFETAPAMGNSKASDQTRRAIVEVLNGFKATLKHQYGVADENTRIVATSAFRDPKTGEISKEGQELVEHIKMQTGLSVKVINGSKEAYYASEGVGHYRPDADGLVIDVGGRSTELAIRDNGQTVWGESLPFGHLTIQALMGSAEKKIKKAETSRLKGNAKKIKNDDKREKAIKGIPKRAAATAKKQARQDALEHVIALVESSLEKSQTENPELSRLLENIDNLNPTGGGLRKLARAFGLSAKPKFEITPGEDRCVVLADEFQNRVLSLEKKPTSRWKNLGIPERKHKTLPAVIVILEAVNSTFEFKTATLTRGAVSDGAFEEMKQALEARRSQEAEYLVSGAHPIRHVAHS